MQRVLSTVHSAVRGGFLFARTCLSPIHRSINRTGRPGRVSFPFPYNTIPRTTTGGVLSYMRKAGWIKLQDEDTYIDEVVGIALACAGFYFQTKMAWVRTHGLASLCCGGPCVWVSLTPSPISLHTHTRRPQQLPFPLNLLLLPLTILETTLSYYVAD